MRACILGLLAWTVSVSGSPFGTLCLTAAIEQPVLVREVKPQYSRDGREAQVQGVVAFEVTVGEDGAPHSIKLLSPLGFGLDEKAREALAQWRFRPAKCGGRNVAAVILAEVRFRIPHAYYDAAAERQRTAFNVAVAQAKGRDLSLVQPAVAVLRDLARRRFPPAMHFIAKLDEKLGLLDPRMGVSMIEAAAEANYGPALYEIGLWSLQGTHVARDENRALRLIHEAAVLGSPAAQKDLGARYEAGDLVPKDLERARRYFRLCAAKGNAHCQYRLARLLLGSPDCPERDWVQAVAWCQLAAEQIPEARRIANHEVGRMNRQQLDWLSRIRPQLHGGN